MEKRRTVKSRSLMSSGHGGVALDSRLLAVFQMVLESLRHSVLQNISEVRDKLTRSFGESRVKIYCVINSNSVFAVGTLKIRTSVNTSIGMSMNMLRLF